MKRHLKMDSDTDSTNSQSSGSRLGKCEVCNYSDAKYTCPKCEVKTCRLNCLKIHKMELNCDGIRDRTKYVPLNKMTKMDFLNDYNFLEECTRYVENRKCDKIKRYTRYNKLLPTRLFKLRNLAASQERKIQLRFLLEHFTKHKLNTTYYNWKDKCIYWRIEWIFINLNSSTGENLKYIDERCSENERLSKLLDKYLNSENNENTTEMKKSLQYYQSKGISNLKILLKAEGIKKCRNRFYELDCRKTLKDNLMNKTIVEYPIIYLCYDNCVDDFDIIDSDDDVEEETKQYRKALDEIYKKQLEDNDVKLQELSENNNDNSNRETEMEESDVKSSMEKLLIEKKRQERRIKREKIEKEPQNYLFADERLLNVLSDDSSEDSDNDNDEVDGNETEEEQE